MDDQQPRGVGLHITSDPDTTRVETVKAQPRERQTPLRLLLVSDLTPGARRNWRGPSVARRVDASSFAEALSAWAPTLRVDVPNHLAAEPKTLELTLRFASLDDFSPAGVARQVPALARLLAIRTQIEAVRDRGLGREPFRDALGEAGVDAASADALYSTLVPTPPKSAPQEPEGGSRVDRLMGLVDTGDGRDPLGEALGDAVSEPGVSRAAADGLLADFDQKLGGQVQALLAAPAFRRLEAAWRGLKLLADRLPFRHGVRLDVLPVGREALAEALYYQVLIPELESDGTEPPLSAMVLDFAFGQGTEDQEALDDLAGTAASLQVPAIASLDPGFFGPEAAGGTLPLVSHLTSGPEYLAWNKLREKEEARFLALAYPPFLLRPAYGPDHPSRGLAVEEEDGIWGGAALAVALAAAGSFRETGWPTHLTGRRVEDLPTHETARGHTPLQVLLPDDKAEELAEAGFVALTGAANADWLHVAHAANVWRPKRYDEPEQTAHAAAHAALACSLFSARVAQRLHRLSGELDPAAPLEQKEEEAVAAVRRFLGGDLEGDAVSAERVQEGDGFDVLAVRFQPPSRILSRPVHVAVGLPVPRAS